MVAGRDASTDDPNEPATPTNVGRERSGSADFAGRLFGSREPESDDLLAYPTQAGEMRRLTILFADLVDSTKLSTHVEPERYRALVGRYRDAVVQNVNRYEGHLSSTKGDGLLAVFGYPEAHEDDVRRAVLSGLGIVREIVRICEIAQRQWGLEIAVRVGVHRGHVYLDTAQDDVYGLGANLAARVSSLAPPNSVVISDAVEPLVRRDFELEALPPVAVKGVQGLIAHHRVHGERLEPERVHDRRLVGRRRQRARLRDAWIQAQAGTLSTPGIAFVGEPGIGKSRLAGLAAVTVERSGGTVVELAGSAFHARAGMHPIRVLLERRCGIGRLTSQSERLTLLAAEIEQCGMDPASVAALAPVVGIPPEAGYEPVEAEGAKLYDVIATAAREYVVACLGGRPGLVVAEDVHWFDPSTLEVLDSLLRAADGTVLFVITARPGSALDDEWPVDIVKLQALTHKQTDALITSLNPGLTVVERTTVHRRCDGVPFYIEQLVAGLGGTEVPEALYEPLFARLRASANAVPVVEAAGIIGRDVDRGLLGTVCTLSEADIDVVLDDLEKALVFEQRGPGDWRFRHELLREMAVELAPPSVRRNLHARVADALVAAGGDPDWGVVAGHYERADRFDDAAAAYSEATAIARRRGALTEARGYLTRALALIEQAAPGTLRNRRETELRMERGLLFAAADGGLSREAAADFARSVELTEEDRLDDEVLATRLDSLVESFVMRADLRGAAELLASLREDIGTRRPWMQMIADIWSGVVACLRGEFDAAQLELGTATTKFVNASAEDVEAYSLNVLIVQAYTQLASVHLVRGDLAAARAELSRAEQLVQGLGYPEGPFNAAWVRFGQIWLHVEAGELGRAAELAADVTALAERYGLDVLELFGATWQASIQALAELNAAPVQSDSRLESVAAVAGLVDKLRAVELNELVMYFCGVVVRALIAAGQLEEARGRVDAALQVADDTELCFYKAELLRFRGHTRTDEVARRADFGAARELASAQGATLFELRAALDEVTGADELAWDRLRNLSERFPTNSDAPEFARARTLLENSPR